MLKIRSNSKHNLWYFNLHLKKNFINPKLLLWINPHEKELYASNTGFTTKEERKSIQDKGNMRRTE